MSNILLTDLPIREYNIRIDIITGEVKNLDLPEEQEMEFIKGGFRASKINIHLTRKGEEFIIGDNKVQMTFKRHDEAIIIMEEDTSELEVIDNVIECTLTTDILDIVGRQVYAQLSIFNNEGRKLINTAFYFYVIKGVVDSSTIQSMEGYSLFQQLTNEVENLINDIEENIMPDEVKRKTAEELRVLAEEDRVEEFNAKLSDIADAIDEAYEKAGLANTKAGLVQDVIDTVNLLSADIISAEAARVSAETTRQETFDEIISDAEGAEGSLNLTIENAENIYADFTDEETGVILLANTINDTLMNEEDGTIKQAEDINEALSNEVDGSIKRAESINAILTDEITGTIKTAEDIKDDLNVSITNAETINNTLSDEDGTIDLANDIHNKLTDINTGAITLAHEINDILTDEETGTIQQAEDVNEELLDTIFEGGQVFEDVNTLKNIRIHYGEDEPDNTPFWYDTSDTTEIERRVV